MMLQEAIVRLCKMGCPQVKMVRYAKCGKQMASVICARCTRNVVLCRFCLPRQTHDTFDVGQEYKRSQNGRKMGVVIP